MVLVAPSICRYAINGRYGGQDVVNIMDMQVDTTGTPTPRSQALFEVAGDLLNNWDDHILTQLMSDYQAVSVSWVDLNTDSGDTGERSSTSANTWPKVGAGVGTAFPANVAMLIRKQIVGTRGRRSGRLYLIGLSEGITTSGAPNTVAAASLTTYTTAFATFKSGISGTPGWDASATRKPVVVHTQRPTPESDPVFNGYSDVESFLPQSLLATQRRRLRD